MQDANSATMQVSRVPVFNSISCYIGQGAAPTGANHSISVAGRSEFSEYFVCHIPRLRVLAVGGPIASMPPVLVASGVYLICHIPRRMGVQDSNAISHLLDVDTKTAGS